MGPTLSIAPFPCPGTEDQPCHWLGLLLVHGPLDIGFSFSSSAFTITIFSQHRVGTLWGVHRGQDGTKEE